MMSTRQSLIYLIVGLVILSQGCATVPTKSVSQSGAEAPTLVVGSKFLFQETDLLSKKTETYIWTVQKIGTYEKKPAYWISIAKGKGIDSVGEEDSYLVADMELNDMARFKDGIEIRSASPCIRTFAWPLYVGKKWISSYDFFDKERGHFRGRGDFVRVESYEEVKVSAGVFQAFKIKRTDEASTYIDYYAPAIGFKVKTISDRPSPPREGKWVTELVEFRIPSK